MTDHELAGKIESILAEIRALRADIDGLRSEMRGNEARMRSDLAMMTSRQNSEIDDAKKKPIASPGLFRPSSAVFRSWRVS